MNECVFCRIARGEIPNVTLFEDGNVLAFLDIRPAAQGHALIIPKKHYATLLDMPHPELKELVVGVQKVAAAAMTALPGAEGFNVLQSNNEAAGQVIGHVHFHVIPRKKGDRLSFAWEHGKAELEELKGYAELVKGKMK